MRQLQGRLESNARCRVAQTEIAVADHQESAGLEATFEIGNRAGKILETDKMVATRHAWQPEAAVPLFERDRRRGVVVSVIVLAASSLLYLVLRIGFTTGYEHQIDPAGIMGRLASLTFPAHFFVQLILAQGILILLLVLIAMKAVRYAVYLAAAGGVMALVAIATGVTDVGLLVGEALPFYAVIFILTWNGALPMRRAGKSVIRVDTGSLD